MYKKYKIIFAVIVAVFILVGVIFMKMFSAKPTSRKENGVKQLNFEVGEKINGYEIYDENDNILDISQLPGKNKLVIFAWDKCGDCREEYDNYKLLFQIYDSEDLDISFVWDDTIPYEELNNMMILKGNSYSAKGTVKFTDWVPSYFLLNEENEIILKETELNEVIAHIKVNYNANSEKIKQFIGDSTILLGMERCSGCKKAYEEMSQNQEIDNLKYIINGEVISDWSEHPEVIPDYYSILASSLGKDLFPQVVRVLENGEIEVLEYDEYKNR